jgi:hypothetical protein
MKKGMLERVTGIEPVSQAWKGRDRHCRLLFGFVRRPVFCQFLRSRIVCSCQSLAVLYRGVLIRCLSEGP